MAQRNREKAKVRPESGRSEPLLLYQSLLSPLTLTSPPSGVQVPYSDVEVLKTVISVTPLTRSSRAVEVRRLVLRFLAVMGRFKRTKVPDVPQV